MKKRTGILGVLIAIVLIGIGYAAVTAVNLTINGNGTITPNDENFKVVYTGVTSTANPTTINVATDTIGAEGVTTTSFTVTNMTKKDDTVTLTYTIQNKSADYKAVLNEASTYLSVTGDTEYFSVTPGTFASTTLNPDGTTTQTVTVTALKTPADTDKSVTITLSLTATAQE